MSFKNVYLRGNLIKVIIMCYYQVIISFYHVFCHEPKNKQFRFDRQRQPESFV